MRVEAPIHGCRHCAIGDVWSNFRSMQNFRTGRLVRDSFPNGILKAQGFYLGGHFISGFITSLR